MSCSTSRAVAGLALAGLLLLAVFVVSCGHHGSSPTVSSQPPSSGGSSTSHQPTLSDVLAQIDGYPAPKGVSAESWAALTSQLKQMLVARSKDGKTISAAPAGSFDAVSDLGAESDATGAHAALTWTEVLPGDYNNDGVVDIGDLVPLALYYGENVTTGPDDAHRLVNGDIDPDINIWDLGAIAANYGARIQGYVVYRGHWNGTSVDWETSPCPNLNAANPNWSADRPSPPPVSTRPAYTYTDDISSLTDKANVRYQVAPYGDGQSGVDSNVATMPRPGAFSVSGTVTFSSVGLAGVTLTLSPGGLTAITASDGTYSISNVTNGAYTLTPSETGYNFTSTSLSVTVAGANLLGQDFTASAVAPTHNVSGTVTSSGTGLAGVTLTLMPGGLNATTAADGTFTISSVVDGSYTLTPSESGYAFAPVSSPVTVSGADVTGQSFAATPAHSVSGAVVDDTSAFLAGVTLTLTPGGLTATTASDGTYTISGVQDGSYTLTPSLARYVFSPQNRSISLAGADLSGQNFLGSRVYNVSGTIQESGPMVPPTGGLAGVILTLAPGGQTATTAADGTYTIPGAVNGSYTLTPSLVGYLFTPTKRTVTVVGADVTGQDFSAVLAGLGSTPWPKFRHDAGNTAQSGYAGSQSNTVKWSYTTGAAVYSSPAIAADGTIYVGSNDYNVYALNPADGSVKWTFAAGNVIRSSPAVGSDGTVYVASYDHNVYALNPADGSVKWQYKTAGLVDSSPAIGPDGTIYVGSEDHSVYALSPVDGSLKWTSSTGGIVYGSPAVASDGTVYIGSADFSVYALNPADGSVKWSYATGAAVTYSSPAVASDGTVYIGSTDHKVYALNPTDGTVKWSYTTGNQVVSSPAVGTDGTVYIGSNDRKVYALTSTGTVKWSYTTGFGAGGVQSSPAVGSDGLVYVGASDRKVYALNPADGSVKWSYTTGNTVWSSPAIASDGTTYIGGVDGKVYAFGP